MDVVRQVDPLTREGQERRQVCRFENRLGGLGRALGDRRAHEGDRGDAHDATGDEPEDGCEPHAANVAESFHDAPLLAIEATVATARSGDERLCALGALS